MQVIVSLISFYILIGLTVVMVRLRVSLGFRQEFLEQQDWNAKSAWFFAQVVCWWNVFMKKEEK